MNEKEKYDQLSAGVRKVRKKPVRKKPVRKSPGGLADLSRWSTGGTSAEILRNEQRRRNKR